jgi:hypothetical protein
VPGSIALVVTNDLRVRSKPVVSDDSAKLTPLLQRGREVFVAAGPVAGSGFEWYQVEPVRAPDEFGDLPFGWVAAAGKDGEPWLEGGSFACPEAPTTYRAFVELRPLVGAACLSRQDLTFAARLEQPEATCGVDIGWTVEPDWLGSTCPQPKFLIADPTTTASFYSVLDPDIDFSALQPGVDPPDWIDVDVTGHFDDPAAETCAPVSTDGTRPEIGAAEAVVGCRGQFVITAITPRG